MKRIIIILLSALLLAALPACQAAYRQADTAVSAAAESPATTASGALSEAPAASTSPSHNPLDSVPYINLSFEVPYETIPPVNPGNAQELRIALPADMETPQVIAMPGGGALAVGLTLKEEKKAFSGPSRIIAARYDAKGNLLWTKSYDELPEGYFSSVQNHDGDGFAFTYSVGEKNNSLQFVVFCAGDGHIYYKESSSQSMKYQYILGSDSCGAIAVGEAEYKDGKPVKDGASGSGEEMLSILTQSAISSVFFSRSCGVDGYFSPMAAILSPEAGLVVLAQKKQAERGNRYEVLAFDTGTLQQKWRFSREAQGNQYIGNILAANGGVLVSGFDNQKPFILKLNPNGEKLWEIQPDGGGSYSVIEMAAFEDGSFAAAINRYEEGDSMHGLYLALYGADGSLKRKLKLPNETIRDIKPLKGGGFVTVGTQCIKTIPQPAYVSSIWYDTETIVTRYDENLNILWRNVYDKYKDTTRQDVAVPTTEGQVIVER